MGDILSKKERSRLMSLIKSRDTAFELKFLDLLSAALYPKGYRYRKHYRGVEGKPDIAFVKQKVAVFLDSDFWHGRNHSRLPKLKSFWRKKIERNMERDRQVNRSLRRKGWIVLRFGAKDVEKNPARVIREIEGNLKPSHFLSSSPPSLAHHGLRTL